MADLEDYRRIYSAEQAMRRITTPLSPTSQAELTRAEERADNVAVLHGERAPPPIMGESPLDYRKRLLAKFKSFSPEFGETSFLACDEPTIAALEARIYDDASAAAARHDHEPGHLRSVEERDAAGRLITRYYGDIGVFMDEFAAPGARVQLNHKP